MKSETIVHHHPPTPPSFNAEGSFSYDDLHSHGAGYGTPGAVIQEGLSQHSSHPDNTPGADYGLGIHYDGYSQGSGYYPDPHFSGMPADKQKSNHTMFSGSPPTPRSATENDDLSRRTRSGRTIAPSSSPRIEEKPRPKAIPKSKKAKAGKGEKPKTPKLTAPLSILTKDMAGIPVRNMEEWVNRPADVRRKEVERRNGYVTRPMNSFMLYRSAYAERTKQWCLQNNHQVVSSVSGESWPMEPPEIRELYNEYAKIERINHQNAHPTYKFSPSKASTPAKKRKGEYADEEEPSDLDDAEWAPGHGRTRIRTSKRPNRSLGYPAHSMEAEYFDRSFGPNGSGMNKSSWEMTNDGRPMPMPMGQNDLYNNQYFQASVHPNMGLGTGMMEDLRLRRVDTPASSLQFSPGHALLGLPGGNAADLIQQLHSHTGTPLDEPQVDPLLLAFDGDHHQDLGPAVMHPTEFRNGHIGLMERELDPSSVDALLGTAPSHEEYHPESWQSDPTMAALEPESEFEKWMGEH
ncbi:HMG box protein [Corynespora cassiicola Philippines]|uniref:HMG box protein n=1 Tax=Corynespora cassiicola Philippines TaxID=1448308 RepID=A0A2T2P5F1_CORCC|nr:HMG box protein [Corynespora cassiicola Philippines]